MADYEIPFTDSANKGNITVAEGAYNNTDTSLTLPGRLLSDYGQFVNTNFLQMLENFANVNPPSNPVEGQLWYDTTDGIDQLKIYDGTNWVSAGGLKKGAAEPAVSNSVIGDIWVNTSTSQLYIYSGSSWILVGPNTVSGNKSGAFPEEIIDTGDVSRTVIAHYIDGDIISIVSELEFTPKAVISGFSSIKVGITPSSNVSYKFNGIADKAENLQIGGSVVPTTDVMRNNIVNQVTELLRIRNNEGIEVGTTKTLSMIVEGSSGIIEHSLTGSNLDFRVNNNGTFTTAVRVKSDTNVGINNLNPDESLGVIGNIKVEAPSDDATQGNMIVRGVTNSTSSATGSLTTAGGLGVVKDVYIGGNLVVEGTDPGSTPTITAGSIIPDIANTRSLGSASKPYDTLHANRITGNLTGDVTGSVSGSSGSAAKLNGSTTFQMSGDISSSGFTFDGQTGGSTKTFTTVLSQDFVDNKTAVTEVNKTTDKLLLSRSGALFSATPALILDTIPTIPVGSVLFYGGLTAPDGWFICNNAEVSLTTYGALATALGYDAADSTTYYWGTPSDPNTLFRIPDYRGRFPVGLGLPGGSNRINRSAVGTMGGTSGAQKVTIEQRHIPEHEHDFRSSTGEQFYTTTTATATAPEVVSANGDTAGTGTRMETSGGVVDLTNEQLDITNPFSAINFIIYHGVTS